MMDDSIRMPSRHAAASAIALTRERGPNLASTRGEETAFELGLRAQPRELRARACDLAFGLSCVERIHGGGDAVGERVEVALDLRALGARCVVRIAVAAHLVGPRARHHQRVCG